MRTGYARHCSTSTSRSKSDGVEEGLVHEKEEKRREGREGVEREGKEEKGRGVRMEGIHRAAPNWGRAPWR